MGEMGLHARAGYRKKKSRVLFTRPPGQAGRHKLTNYDDLLRIALSFFISSTYLSTPFVPRVE